MHAKSKVEKGIKFSPNKEDVPNGRLCWIVWVAVDRNEEGSYYAGATACPMLVDTEARRGWKILAQHVNNLDYAIKRRFVLGELGSEEKAALRGLLISNNPEWWDRSPKEPRGSFLAPLPVIPGSTHQVHTTRNTGTFVLGTSRKCGTIGK
jgi:hypothetical protein